MAILPRLFRSHKRSDRPAIAPIWRRRSHSEAITLEVPYLTARQWIDLALVSDRAITFTSLRTVHHFGLQHPWRWRMKTAAQRDAARRLQAAGIIMPVMSDPTSVALTAEGFLRVLRGSWGNGHLGIVPLEASARAGR